MTTEEIRLRIIKEQVNYQNAVESMKKSAEEIQQILSEFTEEDIQKLTSVGINAQMLVSVDGSLRRRFRVSKSDDARV